MTELSAGSGIHEVVLRIWDTNRGWVGSLTGGESPHVGGVALAVPRPSLTGEGVGCDVWQIPVPGHKDVEVASAVAKNICRALNVSVSLTSGIHIDNASPEDIRMIRENCAAVEGEFLRSKVWL